MIDVIADFTLGVLTLGGVSFVIANGARHNKRNWRNKAIASQQSAAGAYSNLDAALQAVRVQVAALLDKLGSRDASRFRADTDTILQNAEQALTAYDDYANDLTSPRDPAQKARRATYRSFVTNYHWCDSQLRKHLQVVQNLGETCRRHEKTIDEIVEKRLSRLTNAIATAEQTIVQCEARGFTLGNAKERLTRVREEQTDAVNAIEACNYLQADAFITAAVQMAEHITTVVEELPRRQRALRDDHTELNDRARQLATRYSKAAAALLPAEAAYANVCVAPTKATFMAAKTSHDNLQAELERLGQLLKPTSDAWDEAEQLIAALQARLGTAEKACADATELKQKLDNAMQEVQRSIAKAQRKALELQAKVQERDGDQDGVLDAIAKLQEHIGELQTKLDDGLRPNPFTLVVTVQGILEAIGRINKVSKRIDEDEDYEDDALGLIVGGTVAGVAIGSFFDS